GKFSTMRTINLFLPDHCLSLSAQPWSRSTKASTCSYPSEALQAHVGEGERAEPICAVGLHQVRGRAALQLCYMATGTSYPSTAKCVILVQPLLYSLDLGPKKWSKSSQIIRTLGPSSDMP
uniref:Uncharacterized protein n=1 Tax=Bubo bubo TaxID=30461 RepID=A0A8C0IFW0_BUBBB